MISNSWPERYPEESELDFFTRIWQAGNSFYRTFGCNHNRMFCSLCKSVNFTELARKEART